MSWEVYQRDNHSKEKAFDAETLAEIASISAEMAGKDPDKLFVPGDEDE